MGCLYKDIIKEKENPCGISATLREWRKYRMIQHVNIDGHVSGKLNM